MFVQKLLIFCLASIVPAFSRPQTDRVIFRENDDSAFENRDILLPAPNNSVEFIVHPKAARSLENGNFFQGDMKLLPEQEKFFTSSDNDEEDNDDEEYGLFTRTGIINTKYRWPKNSEGHVVIPYKIDEAAKYCE
jgi:hypothetical protein